MPDMETYIARIQLKRGLKEDLPSIIHDGEMVFCFDTKEIFIGHNGTAINISEAMIGPTGPTGASITGPTGPTGKSINLIGYADSLNDVSDGEEGDIYLINGNFYTWNPDTSGWDNKGSIVGPEGPTGPQGPAGPQGDQGISLRLLGVLDDVSKLPQTALPGTCYMINNHIFAYDYYNKTWIDNGSLRGKIGPIGPTGPQ